MFAKFNTDDFPFVNVKFGDRVKNEEDFENFLQTWKTINDQKKRYTLIFDTTNIGIMNIKYAFKIGAFMRELQSEETTYINQSIIVVNHTYVRYLLNLVLSFQKPSAPVYIVNDFWGTSVCGSGGPSAFWNSLFIVYVAGFLGMCFSCCNNCRRFLATFSPLKKRR